MNTQTELANSRELIAFAFVEDTYSRTGDLVAGLLPLFEPLLAKRTGRRFDPVSFAADVQKSYDIPMSPLAASGLVEKLAEADLLYVDEKEPNTYRIAAKSRNKNGLEESDAEPLLAEFIEFSAEPLKRVGLQQEPDQLVSAFLQRLTSARFLSFTDRRDKNYFRGSKLTLSEVEDDEQDQVQVEQALDVLCAEFALQKLEAGGASANLLTKVLTGALIAEVVLTLQTPSSTDALRNLTVVLDGPLILDFMDLSTPELRDYACDLFELIGKARVRKVVFLHTIEEMKGTLRAPLEALQRGDQPFGPLGNRIWVDSSHAAYARATLDALEQELAELRIDIVDADDFATEEGMAFCDLPTEESLRNNIGPLMYNLERRIRDAKSVATIIRARKSANSAKSVANSSWIMVTRNDAVANNSERFLLGRHLMELDDVPPALTDRRLAGYFWFSVGGNLGALTRKKLVANCSNVMSPRTDVVSKVRQYLTELDPQKAELFMVLMRDQRAQRCLVHSTLGFPSTVTPENVEELLRNVRLSVAEEARAKAKQREAELKSEYEAKLAEAARKHQEDTLALGTEIVELEGTLSEQKADSRREVNRRVEEVRMLGDRLQSLESSLELDVDRRVQRAALSAVNATRLLKGAIVIAYLLFVLSAALYAPTDRVYRAIIAGFLALIGFWFIPQIVFERVARPIWQRRFRSKADDLGVLNYLDQYETDSKSVKVSKKADLNGRRS